MTVFELLNRILALVQELKPEDEWGDNPPFFEYEYDSDTHWIKLGIPPEWFEDEDEI
jgi:hypothetical protein